MLVSPPARRPRPGSSRAPEAPGRRRNRRGTGCRRAGRAAPSMLPVRPCSTTTSPRTARLRVATTWSRNSNRLGIQGSDAGISLLAAAHRAALIEEMHAVDQLILQVGADVVDNPPRRGASAGRRCPCRVGAVVAYVADQPDGLAIFVERQTHGAHLPRVSPAVDRWARRSSAARACGRP